MGFTGDLVFTLQIERLVKIVFFPDKTISGIQKKTTECSINPEKAMLSFVTSCLF